MNKNLLMIAAVAVGAVMVLNRAAAQVAPAGSKSAPIKNINVNTDLYKSTMGAGSWDALLSGSHTFLQENAIGQDVNSLGVPVSGPQMQYYDNSSYPGPGSGGDYTDYFSTIA